MICQTFMRLSLADEAVKLEGNLDPEQRLLLQNATENVVDALRKLRNKKTIRDWLAAHPGKMKEYCRKEYRRNIERYRSKRGTEEYRAGLRAYLKQHRQKYPERHKAALKRYYQNNPEWFSNYKKSYASRRRELYQNRKKEICARKCELAKTPKYRARGNAYLRRRRREDPQFALADAMRSTVNRAFRRNWIKKPTRTEALIGCTISELKSHIESQFVSGMSWEHRSSFVVDHWIPVAAFDLRDSEEAHLAFNWKNLRPITQHENSVKSDTLPVPLPTWLPPLIAARILARNQIV